MKLRENLNTQKGFKEIIGFKMESIDKRISKISSLISDEKLGVQQFQKSNSEIIKSTKATIITYYFDVITAKYSAGYDIGNIKFDFENILNVMSGLWQDRTLSEFTYAGDIEPYYGTDEYWQVLTLISLGILLNVDDDQFRKIIIIRDKVSTPDILLDFLLSFKDGRQITTNQLIGNKYDKLVQIIIQQDFANIASDVETYLSKSWCREYKEMGWGDTHNNKFNIHTGYWSFECGAIIKLLGVDDNILRDKEYYPYDLVHSM